jgi:hypothetical protein
VLNECGWNDENKLNFTFDLLDLMHYLIFFIIVHPYNYPLFRPSVLDGSGAAFFTKILDSREDEWIGRLIIKEMMMWNNEGGK